MNEIELQRKYYRETPARDDEMHGGEASVDSLAFAFVDSVIGYLNREDVLEMACAR